MIVSLLILVGFAVGLMFLIWLTTRAMARQQAVPITATNMDGAGDDLPGAGEFEEPTDEELVDQVADDVDATIEALTDVVSDQLGSINARQGTPGALAKGNGRGSTGGNGTIPRAQRWEILFESTALGVYSRQLGFFGIELAAFGAGDPQVDYVLLDGRGKGTHRRGDSAGEDRLYMTWRRGKLKEYDNRLLKQAKVDTAGKITMQFYPTKTENMLYALEMKYAGKKTEQQIRKTIFGIRNAGSGYEFFVVDQRYRIVP